MKELKPNFQDVRVDSKPLDLSDVAVKHMLALMGEDTCDLQSLASSVKRGNSLWFYSKLAKQLVAERLIEPSGLIGFYHATDRGRNHGKSAPVVRGLVSKARSPDTTLHFGKALATADIRIVPRVGLSATINVFPRWPEYAHDPAWMNSALVDGRRYACGLWDYAASRVKNVMNGCPIRFESGGQHGEGFGADARLARRDVLRDAHNERCLFFLPMMRFGCDPRSNATFIQGLIDDGLAVVNPHSPFDIVPTTKGVKLAMSRGRRFSEDVIRRAKRDIVERAKEINANPDYMVQIVRIEVFGSAMHMGQADYGDLDLFVSMRRTENFSLEKHSRIWNYHITDYRKSPDLMVLHRLKNRNPVYSFHTIDQKSSLDITATEVIFEEFQ